MNTKSVSIPDGEVVDGVIVSEIEITPVKPRNGLVGFTSFVVNGQFYIGNVAIFTRLRGGYRLVYPNKKVGESSIDLFHPIDKDVAAAIEAAVSNKYNELMGGEVL